MRQRGKGKVSARQKRSHGTYRRNRTGITLVVPQGSRRWRSGESLAHRSETLPEELLKLTDGKRRSDGPVPMPGLLSAALGLLGFGLFRRRK